MKKGEGHPFGWKSENMAAFWFKPHLLKLPQMRGEIKQESSGICKKHYNGLQQNQVPFIFSITNFWYFQ